MLMLRLWQKFKERNKRILAEVTHIQADLARDAPRRSPQIVSRKNASNKTTYFFWMLIAFGAILGWWFLRFGR